MPTQHKKADPHVAARGAGESRHATAKTGRSTAAKGRAAAASTEWRIKAVILVAFGVVALVAYLASRTMHHQVTAMPIDVTVLSTWGNPGEDQGAFRRAYFLAADPAGNVYAYDIETYRLQKFNAKGEFVATIDLQTVAAQKFQGAGAIACDSQGDVYLNEPSTGSILHFAPDGKLLSRFKYGFYGQRGLAISRDGEIYVADTGNQRVCKFDSKGTFQFAWGTKGSSKGQFVEPVGIAVDETGMVYVADAGNHRIERFDRNGKFSAQWFYASGPDGGYPIDPYLAADGHGHLAMTDSHNQRMQFFSLDGKAIKTTRNGVVVSPAGVACDSDGHIYVTDKNYRIQKLAPLQPFVG